MFEGRLPRSGPFKVIFDSLQGLIDDIKIIVKYEGISFCGLDHRRVALFHMEIKRKEFVYYEFDVPMVLYVRVLNIRKTLPLIDKSDDIAFQIREGSDRFIILSERKDGKRKFKFEYKLTKEITCDLHPPEISYRSQLSIDSLFFRWLVREMRSISDKLILAVDGEIVKFQTENGTKFGTTSIKTNNKTIIRREKVIHKESGLSNDIYKEEIISSMAYSTRYLSVITRVVSLSNRVILKMSNDLPLLVEYQCKEYGVLRYYLAPLFSEDIYQ
ncbi:unnamed protein product [Moneuplotes crassus]|uniref:DNA sliding clamp PCNA n=1 Tax=Euplotes crassus TaxID=5936 RepID=A0AAD1XS72_EUPCR|nr:unnamed protein product [Moneuplotes crassus]